jgi:hypothetical protein
MSRLVGPAAGKDLGAVLAWNVFVYIQASTWNFHSGAGCVIRRKPRPICVLPDRFPLLFGVSRSSVMTFYMYPERIPCCYDSRQII